MAAEVGGPDTLRDGLEARLPNRTPRLPFPLAAFPQQRRPPLAPPRSPPPPPRPPARPPPRKLRPPRSPAAPPPRRRRPAAPPPRPHRALPLAPGDAAKQRPRRGDQAEGHPPQPPPPL